MALYSLWQGLSDELDSLVAEFEQVASALVWPISVASFDLHNECVLEGALSRTWQAWSGFCRECIHESCIGTQNGNGHPIAPHPLAASGPHVSAAAIAAKARRQPVWGRQNLVLRNEPTWGDTDALADIVSVLLPSNHAQLSSAFSSSHASAKALQKIRNAAAHHNAQTLSDVVALMPSFLAYPISHSTHALYWVEPTSSEFLIIHTIEDLRDCALSAIS